MSVDARDRVVPTPPFTGGLPWDEREFDEMDRRIARLHRLIQGFPHDERVPEWRALLTAFLRLKAYKS